MDLIEERVAGVPVHRFPSASGNTRQNSLVAVEGARYMASVDGEDMDSPLASPDHDGRFLAVVEEILEVTGEKIGDRRRSGSIRIAGPLLGMQCPAL